MNSSSIFSLAFRSLARHPASLLLLLISVFSLLTACQPKEKPADPHVDYYTCTMHPSLHLHDDHAKCPVCGMSLVPVMKKGATATPAAGTMLSDFSVAVERQQIGVTYATAEKRP